MPVRRILNEARFEKNRALKEEKILYSNFTVIEYQNQDDKKL